MNRLHRIVGVAILASVVLGWPWSGAFRWIDCQRSQAADEKKPDAARDREILNGRWQGTWLSVSDKSSGFVYLADLQLTIAADSSASGQITWTLKKSPHPEEQGKLGLTGVEHVRGHFDPRARLLDIEGVRLDDPQRILGLDRYRLVLAENDRVLGGITASQGTWQGLISLSRAAAP
jgi:hypothetical protein